MASREALEIIDIIELIIDGSKLRGEGVPVRSIERLISDLKSQLATSASVGEGRRYPEGKGGQTQPIRMSHEVPSNDHDVAETPEKSPENTEGSSRLTMKQPVQRNRLSPGEMRGRVRELVDLIGDDSLADDDEVEVSATEGGA